MKTEEIIAIFAFIVISIERIMKMYVDRNTICRSKCFNCVNGEEMMELDIIPNSNNQHSRHTTHQEDIDEATQDEATESYISSNSSSSSSSNGDEEEKEFDETLVVDEHVLIPSVIKNVL